MSGILSTSEQTKWKPCMAPSQKVGLTLISNGENEVRIFTQNRQLVLAGIEAPTAAPTAATGAAGNIARLGYVAYRYCYASSRYPNVEAVTSAGGQLWPKSNPSSGSNLVLINSGGITVDVTVSKSTRADVDKILIYRASSVLTTLPTGGVVDTSILQAQCQALLDAGELNYVGSVSNDGVAGTVIFNDNVPVGSEQEELELDNYISPQFWLCLYEPPYWWGWGNPELAISVTLNSSTSISAAANTFYPGRQNQFVTFDGITSGGFDGAGTFYFIYLSDSVANVAVTQDGAAATINATGSTTMRIRGYSGTLYRSKPNNPFAWGYTQIFGDDNSTSNIRVPQQYAFNVGGNGTAISVLTNQRLLKLDAENPTASYVLNLGLAGQDGFEASKRTLDNQYAISSHHAQFAVTLPDGSTALAGLDGGNKCLIVSNSASQSRFGSEVFDTVGNMVTENGQARLFHGLFDHGTELSLFWLKTGADSNPAPVLQIDTCLCYHGPSGQWSIFRDFDITSSAAIFDSETLQTLILVGTATGRIAQAFVDSCYNQLITESPQVHTVSFEAEAQHQASFEFFNAPPAGTYFDIGDTSGVVRIWFDSSSNPQIPPPAPSTGRLVRILLLVGASVSDVCAAIGNALTADGAFDNVTYGSSDVGYRVIAAGQVSEFDFGTVDGGVINYNVGTSGSFGMSFDPPFTTQEVGTWALLTDDDDRNERWIRGNAGGFFDFSAVFDPVAKSTTSGKPFWATGTGKLYTGIINCEARTYFQPDSSKPGQLKEIWGNFENGSPRARFYEEFSGSPYGSDMDFTFTPIVDINSSASTNGVVRDVPSVLTTSFGIKVYERTFENFVFRGLDFKRK